MNITPREEITPTSTNERNGNTIPTEDHSVQQLRQDYQDAIECIMQCETIIKSLQKQVTSQDKKIVTLEDKAVNLEDKLIQMSLELASSKAFEDEHRSKRRISRGDDLTNDVGNGACPPSFRTDPRVHECAKPTENHAGKMIDCRRRHTVLGSLTSNSQDPLDDSFTNNFLGQLFRKNEGEPKNSLLREEPCSAKSSLTMESSNGQGCTLDDSTSNTALSMLPNFDFGNLFRMNRRPTQPNINYDTQEDRGGKEEVLGSEEKRPRRRPANRTKLMSQKSSRSFLGSAVLFPVSSEDCIKGCIDRTTNKGLKSLSNNETWPEFE